MKRGADAAGEDGHPAGQPPHIMGLRIVKQIVSAHGGRMDFSEDGREVILLLPVTGALEKDTKKEKKRWWEVLWYGDVKGE